MVESIYFLKPAWCGTPCAGLWPEQGLQPVRKAFAFRRWFVTWHPYGVAAEYKFSVPGGMGPAPEPYHFWGRTQCRSEFIKIRIGGYDNETACLSKIPDFAI